MTINALMAMPSHFDALSTYGDILYFQQTVGSTSAGYRFKTVPASMTPKSGHVPSGIVLPNGSKYDPHQTYQAPSTPGNVTVNVTYKHGSNLTYLEDSNSYITNFYSIVYSPYLGYRGTLYAYVEEVEFTATARLVGLNLSYSEFPRQIPTSMSGAGNSSPGMKAATAILEFELFSQWSLNYL